MRKRFVAARSLAELGIMDLRSVNGNRKPAGGIIDVHDFGIFRQLGYLLVIEKYARLLNDELALRKSDGRGCPLRRDIARAVHRILNLAGPRGIGAADPEGRS